MCIELAKNGIGKTSPNPLVGCVVLNSSSEVISTGFHSQYGAFHAERDALSKLNLGEAKGGTLIVNLEPCSHYGKTPPCTDIIIEHKIKKVVIGMRDVNPRVDGISKLKNAGIEVVEGVLEDECKKLNEVFLVNQNEKRTFVAIKTATTLDGKIATSAGSSKWITSSKARDEVKNIRAKYDAILTSSATVLADNPTMLHNKKVILDRNLSTSIDAQIYQQGEIFVFHDEGLSPISVDNIVFVKTPVVDNKLDIDFVLRKLFEMGIMSVLVESGGHINGAFLPFADKIYNFIAPKIIGDNSALSSFDYRKVEDISDAQEFILSDVAMFSPDVLLTLRKKN